MSLGRWGSRPRASGRHQETPTLYPLSACPPAPAPRPLPVRAPGATCRWRVAEGGPRRGRLTGPLSGRWQGQQKTGSGAGTLDLPFWPRLVPARESVCVLWGVWNRGWRVGARATLAWVSGSRRTCVCVCTRIIASCAPGRARGAGPAWGSCGLDIPPDRWTPEDLLMSVCGVTGNLRALHSDLGARVWGAGTTTLGPGATLPQITWPCSLRAEGPGQDGSRHGEGRAP